jgi:hypothetical protein
VGWYRGEWEVELVGEKGRIVGRNEKNRGEKRAGWWGEEGRMVERRRGVTVDEFSQVLGYECIVWEALHHAQSS